MAEKPVPNLEEYVDIEDALKRVCGNKKIYKMLLGKFKGSVQIDQLCEEVGKNDLEAASHIAHTIKGVTANLSLKKAYEKSLDVEQCLKQGEVKDSDIQELREIINTTLLCTEYVLETLE